MLRLRALGSILVVGPSTTPVEAALERFERPQFCKGFPSQQQKSMHDRKECYCYHRTGTTGILGNLLKSERSGPLNRGEHVCICKTSPCAQGQGLTGRPAGVCPLRAGPFLGRFRWRGGSRGEKPGGPEVTPSNPEP